MTDRQGRDGGEGGYPAAGERVTPFRPGGSRQDTGPRGFVPRDAAERHGPDGHGDPADSEAPDELAPPDSDDPDAASREIRAAIRARHKKAMAVEITRRRYFVGAALWGFLVGWLAIPAGLVSVGRQVPWWRARIIVVTVVFVLLCWLGARLINRLYRSTRLKGR